MNEEPIALRKINPTVPIDLECIVQKGLLKEASMKYPSAKEFAENLDRYLHNAPINARHFSTAYRVRKIVHKNRIVFLVFSILVLALGLFSGFFFYFQKQLNFKAKLTKEFLDETKYIDRVLQDAYLAPMLVITTERTKIIDRLLSIQKLIDKNKNVVLGAGSYAIGHGYLQLHEYYKAISSFMTAWNNGYREKEVALDLGQAYAMAYKKTLI